MISSARGRHRSSSSASTRRMDSAACSAMSVFSSSSFLAIGSSRGSPSRRCFTTAFTTRPGFPRCRRAAVRVMGRRLARLRRLSAQRSMAHKITETETPWSSQSSRSTPSEGERKGAPPRMPTRCALTCSASRCRFVKGPSFTPAPHCRLVREALSSAIGFVCDTTQRIAPARTP